MTISEFLSESTKNLDLAGVGTARLDVLVLLEDRLNTNRTLLLAHPEQKLTIEQLKWLNPRILRRTKHEPLAYIRGKTEFYGREFIVNKHVLEPRPESETMIELLLNSKRLSGKVRIADVGAGSGALGITAKLELPATDVGLFEIDAQASRVAQQNTKKFNVNVRCTKSDLLTNADNPYDIILANLPYVPDNYHINLAAEVEPRIAIFGGGDGLDLYRRFFAQLANLATKPRIVLTESLPPQHEKLSDIARGAGFKLTQTDDFIQQFEPV